MTSHSAAARSASTRGGTGALVGALLLTAAAALAADAPPTSDGMPANCPMHAQHMAEKAARQKTAGHDQTATMGEAHDSTMGEAHDSTMGEAHGSTMGHDHAAMNARGEEGMGFSQTATTHHFLLTAAGGEIRVEANDPTDAASRDQIRGHLVGIARSFAAGDFAIPMFVHAQTPPGVPTLERLRGAVDYLYADLANGGRVEIKTTNPEALEAIHQFLRFQIEEHKTGDPETPAS